MDYELDLLETEELLIKLLINSELIKDQPKYGVYVKFNDEEVDFLAESLDGKFDIELDNDNNNYIIFTSSDKKNTFTIFIKKI